MGGGLIGGGASAQRHGGYCRDSNQRIWCHGAPFVRFENRQNRYFHSRTAREWPSRKAEAIVEKRVARPIHYPRNDPSERRRELWRSLSSAFSLIWRTRSRVICSRVPMSSSVIGSAPSRPK